uniref:Transmembrane protein n=1 Tax=Oryza meridionalis TaxID=40149 RepID=A0A0E0EHF6_9ORYZ
MGKPVELAANEPPETWRIGYPLNDRWGQVFTSSTATPLLVLSSSRLRRLAVVVVVVVAFCFAIAVCLPLPRGACRFAIATGDRALSCDTLLKQLALRATFLKPMDLPYDIIRHNIMPLLPAADLIRSQLIAPPWRKAFVDAMQPPSKMANFQPRFGGKVSTHFLLPTDKVQKIASKRMFLPSFPRIDRQLEGHHPVVVSESFGLYCVITLSPEQMWVTNPVRQAFQLVDLPAPIRASQNVGIAVLPEEKSESMFYRLVLPIAEDDAGEGTTSVSFLSWTSNKRHWMRVGNAVVINTWAPLNALQINESLYFQLSQLDIVRVDHLDRDDVQITHVAPPDDIGPQDTFALRWKGDDWDKVATFPLLAFIEKNMGVWGAISQTLRFREKDSPESVLSRISERVLLMGCCDGYALLKLSGKRWAFLKLVETDLVEAEQLEVENGQYYSWSCNLGPSLQGSVTGSSLLPNRLLFDCCSSLHLLVFLLSCVTVDVLNYGCSLRFCLARLT